ncbi:hypothetical protein ACHAXS_006908, partial [Conticribra weissflogii]
RHFGTRQNRLAGLAFVKASTPVASEKNEKIHESANVDQNHKSSSDEKGLSAESEEPSWLREKSNEKKDESVEFSVEKDVLKSSDEEEILDDEEMRAFQGQETKFKELLARVTTSKNPISTSIVSKQKTKQEKIQSTSSEISLNQHDEIGERTGRGEIGSRGIEIHTANDDLGGKCNNSDINVIGSGLGFSTSVVPSQFDSQDAKAGSTGPSFPYFSKHQHEPNSLSSHSIHGIGMKSQQGLGENFDDNPDGMRGLGIGSGNGMKMEASFPSLAQTMNMGLGVESAYSMQHTKKQDRKLGAWEKHTKGIGMKLLQKMGYEGSGGLGAKRKRKAAVSADAEKDVNKGKSAEEAESLTLKSGPNSHDDNEVVVKKGISRPVEVVVRPAGLGLGYGSFKEASQLKVNRQIEAEVRGIDPSTIKTPKLDEDSQTINRRVANNGVPESLLPNY